MLDCWRRYRGSPETVERGLARLIETVKPDEIIIPSHMYAQKDRLRSFELIAGVRKVVGY